MSRKEDRDEPLIPAWDGEPAGWTDYNRRVRLCHAQTAHEKRYLLGPKLVIRLKGKAWEIASAVNHEKLSASSGAQYLLLFLKERLGRLPIPDLGHLDDFFVKLRRAHGTDMVSWCNRMREAYRKLRRSLARTRPTSRAVGVQTTGLTDQFAGDSGPQSPSSTRQSEWKRSSWRTSHPRKHTTASQEAEQIDEEDRAENGTPSHHSWSQWGGWDWAEWQDQSWWHTSSSGYCAEIGGNNWDEFDPTLLEILPEEVLGWLLLRRSGLPASARLSIQAAAGNSMKFSDIEKAMRQQEDELRNQERNRQGSHHHQRSFWVEEDDQWGLVLQESEELNKSREGSAPSSKAALAQATNLGERRRYSSYRARVRGQAPAGTGNKRREVHSPISAHARQKSRKYCVQVSSMGRAPALTVSNAVFLQE